MFDTLTLLKAMADENRVRILMALPGKELCVCTLSELLDLAPSTTSKHLSVLRQARLIESVKDGKFVYYRLAGGDSANHGIVAPALVWLERALQHSPQIKTDAERLRRIIEESGNECTDLHAATENHKLYRHVPGIHAIGDFGGK